jgi:hypothetical protein
MRRALLLWLGIAAVTWLQFEYFPGHTYLQSDTQIYVPILERLNAPGYLSRDLVATRPVVTYTAYDEVTLFLREAGGLDFKTALMAQQVVCRAAFFLGVFLLVKATGLGDLASFAVAMLLSLGAILPGPKALLVEHEPVPGGLSLGLVFLSMGLLARGRPLLAGLAGGIALVYSPAIAAPLWSVVLIAFLFDRKLRALLRPALTIFVVFILLLANLAQLQPGATEMRPFFGRLSDRVAALQQLRTGYLWVSVWAGKEFWNYLALFICACWAMARIWAVLNRQTRWLFVALALGGVATVPVSYILLDRMRWALIPQVQPTRGLLFTVAIASITCSVAGLRTALTGRVREAYFWFLVVFAIAIKTRVLELLRPHDALQMMQSALCLALAGGLTLIVRQLGWTKWRAVVLLIPLAATAGIPAVKAGESYRKIDTRAVDELADWAERNTWGSSMFLFPDAGRELYPGIFRAESRRAVWVDWESGIEVKYFDAAANEWWNRWQQTMQSPFSPGRIQRILTLPIDYYVLRRTNRLADVRPAFANNEFVVYDARDLKNAAGPLEIAAHRRAGR